MANLGRPPKPSGLKLLAGNPGKRKLNDREAKPERAVPPCPEGLGDEAKKEWRRISKELFRLGLLSEIDRAALAVYCVAWGRWLEAEEKLRQHGVVVKSPSGYPIQSPFLTVANQAMKQMTRLLVEFGMSPSSRSRVTARPQEDEEDEFLPRPRPV